MLRITENLEDGQTVRLRLDGTVSTENFSQLEELCTRHRQRNGRTVILDMAGVNFMSEAAAKSVARLNCDSLRIINCSPFIAALLNAARDLD